MSYCAGTACKKGPLTDKVTAVEMGRVIKQSSLLEAPGIGYCGSGVRMCVCVPSEVLNCPSTTTVKAGKPPKGDLTELVTLGNA